MAFGGDGSGTAPDSRQLGAAILHSYALVERPGIRMVGEISPPTRPVWRKALGQLASQSDHVCFLELSAITFVDVAGAAELARTAQSLQGKRRLVLEQPPPELERILQMFWPDLLKIEVAA
ncbi:STAS domain-containing protein [Streptomyces sp. NPDC005551]|uniref:STAS domain-containing protein n=1 Tax=unclassified Streptomyces TaxID=2593676 RepID=UPI003407722D